MRWMSTLRAELTANDQSAGTVRTILRGCAVLAVLFSVPLFQWLLFGWRSDTQSYLLLIPPITLYLIYTRKEEIPFEIGGSRAAALSWGTLAALGVVLYVLSVWKGFPFYQADALTPAIAGLACAVNSLAASCLGPATRSAIRFPLLFLFLATPLTHATLEGLETFLQYASAEVTEWLLLGAGLPHIRDGLIFKLPGITLRVAQECSGVRSTLVLFITSLVGGHLMLRSTVNRVWLVVATWGLGVLRNGFRILVISWLCIEQGPHMINSAIHTRGGPVFFVVSLLPLAGLLWLMVRMESRSRTRKISAPAPVSSETR